MNKRYEMHVAKRYYPDKDFEDFTSIVGRKEIVTADAVIIGGIKLILFYDSMRLGDTLLGAIDKFDEEGNQALAVMSEEDIMAIVEEEKNKLNKENHIVYLESYIGAPLKGPEGFEFCGFDLVEDFSRISAITNCGDLNANFVHKLNKYGLLDSLEDAIAEQKQLQIDYPDEEHADCEVFGVWRYLKP